MLARFEPDHVPGADGCFLARLGVSADTGIFVAHLERSKSPQNDRLAILESSLDSINNRFDRFFGFYLAEACIFRYEINNIDFGQCLIPIS